MIDTAEGFGNAGNEAGLAGAEIAVKGLKLAALEVLRKLYGKFGCLHGAVRKIGHPVASLSIL